MEDKQKQYARKRLERAIGLSIDQSIHGMRNIIVYCNPELWTRLGDDLDIINDVKISCEEILLTLQVLEKKLLSLADIYQPRGVDPDG